MTERQYKIGRYLLDTLTSGMYNNPLCIFREYIQNASDSIDAACKSNTSNRKDCEIRIKLDPVNKHIEIFDNGNGIDHSISEETLLSIGDSNKFGLRERGFRGIGRLGGVAYCDTLIFRTKALNSHKETVSTWNCQQIRQLLSPSNRSAKSVTLTDLIDKCAKIELTDNYDENKSFFKVEMKNVKCSKDILLDVRAVRHYLCQVAPVSFDFMKFTFAKEIDGWLNKVIPNYNTYRIYVNNDEVLKPYCQTLIIRNDDNDLITNIITFDVTDNDGKAIAHGWYGKRKDNIGQINPSEGVDSVRVRVGNILLGDRNLLNECFQEARFNRYNIGEVHIKDPELVPNARRDDFEDSDLKSIFFDNLEKEIGIKLRKEAREASKINAVAKPVKTAEKMILKIQKQEKKGFICNGHKDEIINDLRKTQAELEKVANKRVIPSEIKNDANNRLLKIDNLISNLQKCSPDITLELAGKYSKRERVLIQTVLEKVYELHSKNKEPQKLVEEVVHQLARLKRNNG